MDTVLKGERSINQSASRKDTIVQEQLDNTTWRVWRKSLRPLYYAGSSKIRSNSHRLWRFYYSCNKNTVNRGYCKDWHSNTKYQFDAYQGEDDEVFDFDPIDRNIGLKHMLDDTVPVDIA